MILFFQVDKDVVYDIKDAEKVYTHQLEAPNASNDNVYFSTPSDFKRHSEAVCAKDPEISTYYIYPQKLQNLPTHIGFQDITKLKELIPGNKIKIAIINAMSHAFGDHLIGMQAYDYWYEQICQMYEEVEVNLFQVNPYKVLSITKQWRSKFKTLYPLPNELSTFQEHDAFIDFGSMLLRESIDKKPMIDFFLEGFSINPETVPVERKRIKYKKSEVADAYIEDIFKKIRAKKRPILMFHHTSTSPIRSMSHHIARKTIEEIINTSDYFVISACNLEFYHSRFLDLSPCSIDFDHFASIISKVDALITVDTSAYHLADAFDIPTAVLFTTIDPKLRTPYYPHVKSIYLNDGRLQGRHGLSKKEEVALAESKVVEDLWAKLNVHDVLEMVAK